MCGTFVSKVAFHIIGEQLHELPLATTTLNSFHWGLNLVLSKAGVHILIDVIIINWTCKNFCPHHALYEDSLHWRQHKQTKEMTMIGTQQITYSLPWLEPNKQCLCEHIVRVFSKVYTTSKHLSTSICPQPSLKYEIVIWASTFLHQ
jgi:hypothetical protein